MWTNLARNSISLTFLWLQGGEWVAIRLPVLISKRSIVGVDLTAVFSASSSACSYIVERLAEAGRDERLRRRFEICLGDVLHHEHCLSFSPVISLYASPASERIVALSLSHCCMAIDYKNRLIKSVVTSSIRN